MKFAKIFEFDDEQVLVTRGFDEEGSEDLPIIELTTDIGVGLIKEQLYYKTEEIRDKAFEEILPEHAKSWRDERMRRWNLVEEHVRKFPDKE